MNANVSDSRNEMDKINKLCKLLAASVAPMGDFSAGNET